MGDTSDTSIGDTTDTSIGDTSDTGVVDTSVTNDTETCSDGDQKDTDSVLVPAQSDDLNVQIYHADFTVGVGDSGVIQAELGYGSRYTDPETWATWQTANYSGDSGSGNEYDVFTGSFSDVELGVYFFVFRVSSDGGLSWTYCDTTWTDPYDGYDVTEGGVMTVTDSNCVPGANECQDCEDNDLNGLVDGFDPKCLFGADRLEVDLRTNIPGDETSVPGDPYDCFVDGNSGSGDDVCEQSSCCELADPSIDDYLDLVITDTDPGVPNCAVDCMARCGDGLCSLGESSVFCPADCAATCGDSTCDSGAGETAATCPADCSVACGDGMCTHGETFLTCSADCEALCGNGACELGHPECNNYDTSNCFVAPTGKYQPIAGCANSCAPFVPSGCDCWGCCTICIDNICRNVFADPHTN
ncbi:MAG: hypothetical protein JXR76_13395 [Deltaproteobacteria bacterium]|nr:hypothetical protein [Deltaproteobacteria bacterium]